MGFFSSTGEKLFGTKSKKKANKSISQTEKKMGQFADKYDKQGNTYGTKAEEYDEKTKQNLGTSAEDFMNKQGSAAEGYVNQQADSAADYIAKQQAAAEAGAQKQGMTAATQGTQAALRSARSSGLSKGQSALVGAQQAGDLYTNAYEAGLESGKQNFNAGAQNFAQGTQNYTQGAQMQAAQGSELASRQAAANASAVGALTGQANIAQNQYQNAANKSAQTWGTVGTLASSSAMMLSDEKTKTNIVDINSKEKELDKTKEAARDAASKATAAPATPAVTPLATPADTSKGFDKDKLAGILSGIGKGSGINASSPITTGGVNAADDTTAASRKQLNDSIMNIATYMKDGPMKKINSILGQGTDMKAVQTATNSAKTAAGSGATGGAAASGAAAGSGAGAAGSGAAGGAAATGATTGGAGAAGAAGGGGSAAAAGGAAKGAGILAKLGPLAALSDENTKTDIKSIRDRLNSIDVKEIAKKIRPVSFEYKEGVEEIDPRAQPHVEHVGVIAQDLEKTALAPAVKTGEDGIKRIDIAELAPALLNMIVQQQAQIDELKKGMK